MAGDYITSSLAVLCYNCLRYSSGAVVGQSSLGQFLASPMTLTGQVVFPLAMMGIYCLSGYYNEVFRKSRLQELLLTMATSVVSGLMIFFVALINDMVLDRKSNYEMIAVLLALLFFMVYAVRAAITNQASRRIKGRRWAFATLVVGSGREAVAHVRRMEQMRHSLGYDVKGFVSIPGERAAHAPGKPVYTLAELPQVCRRLGIKELIVAPSTHDPTVELKVINSLFALNLPIKITPDRYSVLRSRARLSDLCGDPLIDISGSGMGECAKNVKRCADVAVSAAMLLLLSPLYAAVAVAVKLDSRGSVFYSQERVGLHNRPFRIYKFRTMVQNAESGGRPQLSSENDSRVTRVGRVLRKYRIDELPQFWNVLRGDMSLVGPRPERQYYVNQILEREPAYSLIHQIRPGITSMGMVKFGYASSLDDMLKRVDYDLLYLENMSLLNDLKILAYTVRTVVTGKGV